MSGSRASGGSGGDDGRRVVITGQGWVTPLGCDVESVWTKLCAGASAVRAITRFDAATMPNGFAAESHGPGEAVGVAGPESGRVWTRPGEGFLLEQFMDIAAANHATAGLSTRFALAAAAQAWVQAGLGDKTGAMSEAAREHVDPDRFGAYLGAGEGSLDYDNFFASNLAGWDAGDGAVDGPAWAAAALGSMSATVELEQEPNATLSHLAAAFGCRGPALNCMTACAASTQAVGEAYHIIRRGDADLMFAGGAHSMIHPLGVTGFARLTAMSTRRDDPSTASRPFSESRDGFVMGDGAGVVILESLESARRRGATVLAEVAGFGSSADAYRITDIQPDGAGAAKAMRAALSSAGIDPSGPDEFGRPPVQYLSAHGTGTPENDGIESKAVMSVFGGEAPRVPFSSVKSMLGHLIQAAGAVELITCVQAIRTGIVPPTINLNDPDPGWSLDHVPNEARRCDDWAAARGGGSGVDVCLSNSFGFGGQNDTVCVRRFEG